MSQQLKAPSKVAKAETTSKIFARAMLWAGKHYKIIFRAYQAHRIALIIKIKSGKAVLAYQYDRDMAVRHKHIPQLQSFRGIAALVVLLYHCTYYFAMPVSFYPVAQTIFNGHAAVIAFFVLSGYVLTMALDCRPVGCNEAIRFLTRRAFRIYPAIWAVCAFSLILLHSIDHGVAIQSQSHWASAFLRPADESAKSILASFFGLGTFLVPPMWSIAIELAGSVLVLLMAISAGGRPKLIAGFIVVLAVLSLILPSATRPMVLTACMVYFALGASIPLWAPPLVSRLGPTSTRWIALLCLVIMTSFRLFGGWDFFYFFDAPLPSLVEGAAATVLIALIAIHPGSFSLLARRTLVSLGDISYSLYLVHFPIMVAAAALGAGWLRLGIFSSWPLSAGVLTLTTLSCSISLAFMLYRWIELPSIALGNRILSRILQLPRGIPAT